MNRTQGEELSLPVSLIVCSRNRPQMLADTIASILQGQSVPAELIIIDQSDGPNYDLASRDDPVCEIRYRWTTSVGLSRGNNIGANLAQYDLLAFTHDDVLVTPTWLHALVQALTERGPGAVVTGRVLPWEETVPGGFAPALKMEEEAAVYNDAKGIGMLKPLNMALYRTLLSKIGGFDIRLGPGTAFPGAEDSDLGFRILRNGFLIAYIPQATVYHRAWRPQRDYLPLRWQYGIAQGAFYAKHLQAGEPWIGRHILWDLRRRTRRFLHRLWREPGRAPADPIYLFGNLVGATRWLLTRQGNAAPDEKLHTPA